MVVLSNNATTPLIRIMTTLRGTNEALSSIVDHTIAECENTSFIIISVDSWRQQTKDRFAACCARCEKRQWLICLFLQWADLQVIMND